MALGPAASRRQAAPAVKPAFASIAALAIAFGATTWWALESGGIAVVETRSPEGTVRSTHVWYVERGGELWLEAGSPENGWFRDVQNDPVLTFRADGNSARYVARPVEDSSTHQRVRSLVREKYGIRDRWIGLGVDASRSVAVRLLPAGD
jgi:hypothetical protein